MFSGAEHPDGRAQLHTFASKKLVMLSGFSGFSGLGKVTSFKVTAS